MKPTFKLASPETGTEYWIYVEAPEVRRTADGGQKTEPQSKSSGAHTQSPALRPLYSGTLLFLDGDDQFAAGVAAYRKLPADAQVPPLLLVGVGYGASYAKPANKRGRDYTPAPHSDEPSSGGAPAFLAFLTATLWPELARRYPVNPASRGIAGHSLSSLFVLYALFQPRPFFSHYLASAPSIWWADRAILQQVATLRAGQDKLPARLFLCAGEEDTASMAGDLALLEAQLAAQPFAQLEIITRRFAKRNHFNVLPIAFATGMTALFGFLQNEDPRGKLRGI